MGKENHIINGISPHILWKQLQNEKDKLSCTNSYDSKCWSPNIEFDGRKYKWEESVNCRNSCKMHWREKTPNIESTNKLDATEAAQRGLLM